MSHDPSRKKFLAKLTGLVAVAGLAPKLLAKPQVPARSESARLPARSFSLRPESRAVARRDQVI